MSGCHHCYSSIAPNNASGTNFLWGYVFSIVCMIVHIFPNRIDMHFFSNSIDMSLVPHTQDSGWSATEHRDLETRFFKVLIIYLHLCLWQMLLSNATYSAFKVYIFLSMYVLWEANP